MKEFNTIRKWFGDNPPDFIQFPRVGNSEYGLEIWAGVPTHVMKWSECPSRWLDKPFSNGYGTAHVPYFVAWSKDEVFYVHEYDGMTSLGSVPRNPLEAS